MKIAPEALPFVLPFALASISLLALQRTGWAMLVALCAIALLLFFRIPDRPELADPEVVVAPASGWVTRIDHVEAPELGSGRFHRVVIFLSVFDVHVQRSPVAGEVVASRYRRGRKVAAFRSDAGEVNESLLTVLRRPNGDLVGVRQIAGLLARRVVSYLEVGRRVRRGELMGLIKFGSRVDLLLPEAYEIQIRVGDHLLEGATIAARAQSPRSGEESDPS
ncbi:MAG: phosphatidylserine decarboxylase [Thermoanaerobaculia bacterium]